ncbi:hypothetical protein BKA70DRAFT_1216006 [Coprinopsis sp. MPI-PUGE-AT-0042]|nr:hypothetical protein BKA70DRAFT_1216006 [Coprinopsis sp. MPI-PUGE-AT-0042]
MAAEFKSSNEKKNVALAQAMSSEHGLSQAQGDAQRSVADKAPTASVAGSSDDVASGTKEGSSSPLPSQWGNPEMQFRGLDPIHLKYWHHGDQAGGFLLKFGEYKGYRVRETPWYWLERALKESNDEPRRQAARIAIARFKAGFAEALRADSNWRKFRVTFGSKYYKKPLSNCATWWIESRLASAKEDPAWASKNVFFIVAAKAALGLPADPDDPRPKPVDLNDPLFVPRKGKGSQKNKLDKYLGEKELATSSSSAPNNRSPSPSGSDSSSESNPAPTPESTTKGKGKGIAQGKKQPGKAKPATQGDSEPVSTNAPPSQKVKSKAKGRGSAKFPVQKNTLENYRLQRPAEGTQGDPIAIADSEGNAVPEESSSAAVGVDEGPSCSTSLGKRTISECSRSEGGSGDSDGRAVKRLRYQT